MTHSKTQSGRTRWLAPLVGAVGGWAAYALAIRPWHLRWGATAEEAITPLPGDDLVPDAAYVTTRAATSQVPPEAVWPWLVQMGHPVVCRRKCLGRLIGPGKGSSVDFDALSVLPSSDTRDTR